MMWLFYREDWFGFFICVSQNIWEWWACSFWNPCPIHKRLETVSPHVMTLVKGIGSSLQFYLYVKTHTCYVCLCVHLYCRMASGQLPDSPRSRSRLSPTGSAITLSPSWQRGLQKCLPRKVSAPFFLPPCPNFFILLSQYWSRGTWAPTIYCIRHINWASKETYHFFRVTFTEIHCIKMIHIWTHVSTCKKNKSLIRSKRR